MDDLKEDAYSLRECDLVEDGNNNANPDCTSIQEARDELSTNDNDADDSSGNGEISESEAETKVEEFISSSEAKCQAPDYEPGEEGDDRSQTPLQDEIDNIHGAENDDFCAKSSNDIDYMKEDAAESSAAKDSTLNDDHGELDYEEDEVMEEGHDKTKGDIYLVPDKKTEDAMHDSKGSDALSSDGELADDDDCEEGEIKEPGSKKPFVRPLCRFFTRGNCTWGINCRFLHPGINDKGNYSLIDQQHGFQPMPPPGMVPMLRGPPPSWVHECLGKRMLPPPRPSEVSQPEGDAVTTAPSGSDGPASESAWERGLRHAKEIQRKRKDTDNDDKKVKEESLSPSGSPPPVSGLSSQLAPPPPRDPYFDDLHRPLPPPMPGRIHPLPIPLHPPLHLPPDAWSYRHPFEYDMRWHRPPPPEFMHHNFPPMHDMRFMDRERMPPGRRFSPPLRMDPGRKDDRLSRYDRYRGTEGPGFDASRGKCEEWKDPWLRTKSPKKKRDSSSSRSRSRKRSRSKRSYSSFSSSSYSSKSRSSSSSSYSSSRSSMSSRSRSRSSSKSSNSIPRKSGSKKMSPFEKLKASEPLPKSVVTKVIPPSLADMANMSNAKLPSTTQVLSPSESAPQMSHSSSSLTPHAENAKPTMSSLSITIAGKQSGNMGRSNQLQPVGRAVAEAFKDVDEENENVKVKSRMTRLTPNDLNKPTEVATASGLVYKSGIVQGNVSYPIPMKAPSEGMKKNAALPGDKLAKRTSGSSSSSRSSSSHSHSSSSHSEESDHIYSDIASPISSDSPISPPKSQSDRSRVMPQKASEPFMHRTMSTSEKERREAYRGNKHFEPKPERRDTREVQAPDQMKIRRDYKPDYPSRSDARTDQKLLVRKPGQATKMDAAHQDMRGDGRDYFKGDTRRLEQRMDLRGLNVRREHSRERSRERIRPGSHIHVGRRDEGIGHSRVVQDPSMEYRRVVHSGSSSKGDARHQAPLKRTASPHSQRSPKRVRPAPSDHKEPVKIPIPKSEKGSSGRGNTRMTKEGFEEDARPPAQPSAKQQKAIPKKSTSTKREELLLQLKAVEDAIAKKRSKNQ